MTGPVRIHEVRTWLERRRFLRFPCRLYANDSAWVAPLHSTETARWDAKRNHALRKRFAARFLATRGSQVLGRIAAIVDDGFAAAWQEESAFFGFFECREDKEAAAALFQAVDEALRRRKRKSILGPINLTTNDEVGFLVDGWNIRPSVLSPYNPPYYAEMALEAGYTQVQDYLAFRWTPESSPSGSIRRLLRAAEGRASEGGGLSIRAFKEEDWDTEVALLHRLYNQSFEGLWGFVPMSAEEFRGQAENFRPFFRPSLIAIAEDRTGPVGFAVILPDVNEILARLGGRLFPTGWIKLVRGLKRIRTARFLIIGVIPSQRGKGIAPLMSDHLASVAKGMSIESAELALVQSTNKKMIHVVESMGCEQTRRFRLMGKELCG